MMVGVDALAALDRVVAALPGGGEPRPGQRDMAAAVARAIDHERHLVVQAGTGTGKTLAYLVPAILAGRRTVVTTATKALQDQLVGKDLPFLAAHLGVPFTYTALKGRSNYLCVQRAREALLDDEQLALDGVGDAGLRQEVVRLVEWGTAQLAGDDGVDGAAGDRAQLVFEPSSRAWAAVSVSARECPGASRCPMGEVCFCERARHAAAEADVVVVNTHLYGMHLASDGVLLPEHDVVVVDEAHQLEEVISATAGLELSPARFTAAARAVRAIVADDELVASVEGGGTLLATALSEEVGRRLRHLDGPLATALDVARSRLERASAALRNVGDGGDDVGARKQRAVKVVSGLIDDIGAVTRVPESHVAWVEGDRFGGAVLKVAPVDVSSALAPLWSQATVVLTSATVPTTLPVRVGLPPGSFEVADVGSPFDYPTNALLYCAVHLPDPRTAGYEPAMHDELAALISAAGGRTLALFTSWRAMTAAVDAVRPRLAGAGIDVLAQGDLPKPALVERFTADEATCLFATMGFWQGVDVPGRTLSLVTVDRLPFPRPDEPLLQARRERARAAAFAQVDLPRATTMLAQGAGRLIRTASDRGVVAVLDPRLATARYRWEVVRALPPMRRSRDRAEVEAFLRAIVDEPDQ
jgi:ATP-dependent DNA helicase DinG